MSLFPKSPTPSEPDNILGDLPRGEEGRRRIESVLPRTYFESPDKLAALGFKQGADNFLGVVNATTSEIERDDGRYEYCTRGGVPVGCRDDRHLVTIAGSRAGKGRSIIIPELLTYRGSMVVVDPKGENCSITARYRKEKLGHDVYVVDPFRVCGAACTPYRARFNPLRLLDLDSTTLVEDAGQIADALVVGGGGEPYWDDTARHFIEAVCLHVATSDQFSPEERHLGTVAALISGRRLALKELLAEMMANDAVEHTVSGAGRAMHEKAEREQSSVVSVARKNVRFLEYDSMQAVLSGHDFDLKDLKRRPMTIYLVLPATRMSTCAQWLRLFVNQTIATVERVRERPALPVIMLLDEFPVLGYMRELEAAIGQVAGLGLRLHVIAQDLGQIRAIYKDRWESFLGNAGVRRFFGLADEFTAKWVSDCLGRTTVTVADVSATTAEQRHTQGASGHTMRQQVQELMTPTEVVRYFARDDRYNRQLVLIPGRKPYVLQRANYDQHELFAGRFDSWP